jgi:hypothetical protein
LERGGLTVEGEAILKRRLEEMLPHRPNAPSVTITITPETTLMDIPGAGSCRMISEYSPATKEIILYPLFVESDDDIANYLNFSCFEVQRFLITCLRDEFGHAQGLDQYQGDKDTLDWLGQEENMDYLEANLAVLGRSELDLDIVYPVGDWLERLKNLTQDNKKIKEFIRLIFENRVSEAVDDFSKGTKGGQIGKAIALEAGYWDATPGQRRSTADFIEELIEKVEKDREADWEWVREWEHELLSHPMSDEGYKIQEKNICFLRREREFLKLLI